MRRRSLSFLLFISGLLSMVSAIELTFELPDNANQCFFEEIPAGVDCIIEFQVVTGGQYDVDMTLEDPSGRVLYKDVKKQYDSFSWKTSSPGAYKACFSNEFSTFSHKVVYVDWQSGQGADKTTPRLAAMTALESSVQSIGDRLRIIDDYQTHHRLREATARKRAEDMNERVLYWSIGQAGIIVCLGLLQVFVLRSFFTDKRSSGY